MQKEKFFQKRRLLILRFQTRKLTVENLVKVTNDKKLAGDESNFNNQISLNL